MKTSRRARAFALVRFSDPGWEPEVMPVASSNGVCIRLVKTDPGTGQKMYGESLANYKYRKAAERLCKELSDFKRQVLATAFP